MAKDPVQAQILANEITTLMHKKAIFQISTSRSLTGFYSKYFLVPKKDGGLRPILDLRQLNRFITLLPFKMLTTTQILESIEPGEWFASIGMKDTEMVIQHVQFLSLKVNWDKSNLNPWQQRVFVGISLDSQLVMASLSPQRVMKLSSLAQSFHLNKRMKLIQFQQLMGMIAAAATVIPLGLLRARPLQRWVKSANLHPKLDRHVRMRVTQICIQMLRPWKNKRLLSQGAPLGNISARRSVITTDASLMGWGAIWKAGLSEVSGNLPGPWSTSMCWSSGQFTSLWELFSHHCKTNMFW